MAKSTFIVLLNLSKWNNPKQEGQGITLDVVQEVKDGKNKGVGVQKAYFMEAGAKRIPWKMERKDFKVCAERWGEVVSLFDNPPPLPPTPEPEPLSGGSLSGGEGLGGGSMSGGKMDREEF